MHTFRTILCILICCDFSHSRIVEDALINVMFPLDNHLNEIIKKRYQNATHELDFQSNLLNYPTKENELIIMNSVHEDNTESDDSNEALPTEAGKNLQQIWELFSKKMKRIEKRVTRVESQTLEILNRLSMIDCSTLPEGSPSGIYTLYTDSRATSSIRTKCEQEIEGGGWTVILKRVAHESLEKALNFSRGLRDYKVGFGDPENDFWIGLENIYLLTRSKDYQLRVDLEDFNGDTAFAHYDKFYLENEINGYKLEVSSYRGNAGDSLTNLDNPDNYTAVGMMFSTHDEDRDTSHEINCSQHWNIGGWWFNRCSWSNLMGPYKLPQTGNGIGINWHKWRNKQYIKAASMMIRPTRPYT